MSAQLQLTSCLNHWRRLAYTLNPEYFIYILFSYISYARSFRTKIKCIRKVQSKSENPQRSAIVRKFHAYETSKSPAIRKFSAYEIFWIYSMPKPLKASKYTIFLCQPQRIFCVKTSVMRVPCKNSWGEVKTTLTLNSTYGNSRCTCIPNCKKVPLIFVLLISVFSHFCCFSNCNHQSDHLTPSFSLSLSSSLSLSTSTSLSLSLSPSLALSLSLSLSLTLPLS